MHVQKLIAKVSYSLMAGVVVLLVIVLFPLTLPSTVFSQFLVGLDCASDSWSEYD